MYKVTKEKKSFEGEECFVYGICFDDTDCVSDISTIKAAVEHLADLFNEHDLSPLHLRDAVEDFMNQ